MAVRADTEISQVKTPNQSTIVFLFIWPIIVSLIMVKCLFKTD